MLKVKLFSFDKMNGGKAEEAIAKKINSVPGEVVSVSHTMKDRSVLGGASTGYPMLSVMVVYKPKE